MEEKARKYSFTFTKQEAIEYYTYLLSSTRANRLKQLYFIFSIPLVILLSYFFFRPGNMVICMIMAAVSIMWMTLIAPRFWKAYTLNNIGEKFLEKNNLTEFPRVDVIIRNDCMTVNGKEYDLNDLIRIVKTGSLTIFFFPGQPVAVPNRVIE